MLEAVSQDEEYKSVIQAIREDMRYKPLKEKENNGHPGREYSADDEPDTLLVYNSNRLVVPRPNRKRVLQLLHTAHPLSNTAIANARDRYFWPHLRQDVINMAETCATCANRAPSKEMEPAVVNPDRVA